MHVIHGTWIPDDTNEFIQRRAFYLWVETDTPSGTSRNRAGTVHPRHLAYCPGHVSHGETGPAGACVWRLGTHSVYKILSAPDGRGEALSLLRIAALCG